MLIGEKAVITSEYSESISSQADIFADKPPSLLFRILNKNFLYLLSNDTNDVFSKQGIAIRRMINPIVKMVGPLFLKHKQVFEKKQVELPDESVIWCGNHSFKDDILATVLSARHSYILLGSLPMFFNTFDGVTSYINGVVLCNRKVKASRKSSVEKCKFLLENGTDLIMFPEGVWNKTPEKLVLDMWPGVYKIAKETGRKIVPVIHYLKDPQKKYSGNVIHTVIADPISMEGLSEQDGLALIRDTIATWYYIMMEKYGEAQRSNIVGKNETSEQVWENYIAKHTASVPFYDREIELQGDFRSKNITLPEDVWKAVANIKDVHFGNMDSVLYARKVLEIEKQRDYQRRY